ASAGLSGADELDHLPGLQPVEADDPARPFVLGALSQPGLAAGTWRGSEAPRELRLVRSAAAVHAAGPAAWLSSVLRYALRPPGVAATRPKAVYVGPPGSRDRDSQVAQEPLSAAPCRGRRSGRAPASAAWWRTPDRRLPCSIHTDNRKRVNATGHG